MATTPGKGPDRFTVLRPLAADPDVILLGEDVGHPATEAVPVEVRLVEIARTDGETNGDASVSADVAIERAA